MGSNYGEQGIWPSQLSMGAAAQFAMCGPVLLDNGAAADIGTWGVNGVPFPTGAVDTAGVDGHPFGMIPVGPTFDHYIQDIGILITVATLGGGAGVAHIAFGMLENDLATEDQDYFVASTNIVEALAVGTLLSIRNGGLTVAAAAVAARTADRNAQYGYKLPAGHLLTWQCDRTSAGTLTGGEAWVYVQYRRVGELPMDVQ